MPGSCRRPGSRATTRWAGSGAWTRQGLHRHGLPAWLTRDYDENDTVLDAPYYLDFMAHYPPNPTPAQIEEKAVLEQAALCYNTPLAMRWTTPGRSAA